MKIKWLGHASFLITSESGVRIITDPYQSGGELKYQPVTEVADIVTVSHDHFDHNQVATVRGNPEVVSGAGTKEVKGIRFRGVPCAHDEEGGKLRGANFIFCFGVDGVKVCHLGDLGHPLSAEQLQEIGAVDVVLIPVGGFYTIDAKVASDVCLKLKPKLVIPMHFKNERCAFPISGVDDFLLGKEDISRLDSSEVEVKREELPPSTRIIVLKPAL